MRSRVVGLALITATFAVALFGIPLAIGLAEFAVSEEHSSLQRLAGFAARSVQSDMAHDRVPRALPDGPSDAAVALYDADGALLLGAGPSVGAPGCRLPTTLSWPSRSAAYTTSSVLSAPPRPRHRSTHP